MSTDSNNTPGKSTASSSSSSSTELNQDLLQVKDALTDGARHVKDELKSAATEAAAGAKKAAESKLDAGRELAADHLGSVADALRKTGKELGAADSPLTDYVTDAASTVDRIALYLQTRTLGHVIGDLEGFARREPALFLGGALAAGILAGRFLKSAPPRAPAAEGQPGAQGTEPAKMTALPPYKETAESRAVSDEAAPMSASNRPTLDTARRSVAGPAHSSLRSDHNGSQTGAR